MDLSKAGAISAARSAYDKLTDAEKALVTNYDVLVEAEAEYARLAAEQGKKLDNIYTTTGDFMATLGTPTVNSIGGEWMVIGLARSGRPVPAGYYDNVAVSYTHLDVYKRQLDRRPNISAVSHGTPDSFRHKHSRTRPGRRATVPGYTAPPTGHLFACKCSLHASAYRLLLDDVFDGVFYLHFPF